MDCLAFRRHHLAYVDDTLPGDVLVGAERHRGECAECAALDTRVRRSLLLARNLPTIEPSADFAARLEARLAEVRGEGPARSDSAVDFDLGAEQVRWYATWVERARRDAGDWGRQAAAAAVLFAAASAGYAVRGAPAGVSESASAASGAQVGVASAASTPSVPALAASASATAESLSRVGATAVNTTEVAVFGVAARAGRAAQGAHGLRRRAADAVRAAGDAFDADGLGTPAYIPLPGGALEAAALLGPASAGVPVWPAALLAGEAPVQLRSVSPGAPSVRVVGLTH